MKNYVIPTREKVAYGSGDLAINLAFDSVNFYMLWFIITVAGISPAKAGLIFLIARVWDAVTDYFMGRISDRTTSKYGRQRPYLIFGALPMGLLFMALWYVPDLSDQGRFLYFLGIYLLFNTAYTVVAVPYGSLMAQMTQHFKERTVLSSFRVGFSFVGSLLAAAGIPLLVDLVFVNSPPASSYLYMGVIFGILMIIILIITGLVSKERVIGDRSNYESFIQTILSFLRLEEFRKVSALYLFNAIGTAIIMALSIFFLSDVLKVGDDAAFFMAIPIVTAICFAPFWTKMSHQHGKTKAYIYGGILSLVTLFSVLIVPEGKILWIVILLIFVGISLSATQIIPMSLLPDVIDIDEYKNHVRREGAFNGLIMFLHKASSGLAVGAVGLIIELFGYVEAVPGVTEDIVQPDSALTAIRVVLALSPALCYLIAMLFAKNLKVSERRFSKIIAELRRRQEVK